MIELTDLVIVVRGGGGELPPPGTIFSGAVGRTLEDAAAYVPHGKIPVTEVRFDETRRKFINTSVLQELLSHQDPQTTRVA